MANGRRFIPKEHSFATSDDRFDTKECSFTGKDDSFVAKLEAFTIKLEGSDTKDDRFAANLSSSGVNLPPFWAWLAALNLQAMRRGNTLTTLAGLL